MKKFTLLLVLLFLFLIGAVNAQKKITGMVTDRDNKPIVGATIAVKGTTIGTLTDVYGKYELIVPEKEKTLVVSFVGTKSQEITIGTSMEINVMLQPDIFKLNELVVTAIGISREKEALGYSVQDVNGDEIARSHDEDALNALNGKVAGVDVVNQSGAAGGSTYITIRGPSSITGDEQPLIVLDGVPIDNSTNITGNPYLGLTNLNISGVAWANRGIDINPEDIESISVLKGGAASALYGLRGANGVIVITTKKGKPVVGGKKFNVNYSFNVAFDRVNKLPGVQNEYAQGSEGQWLGPETHTRTSWGPRMDTMRYAKNNYLTNPATQDPYGFGYYDWNKQGIIVGEHDPHASSTPVLPFDNLNNFFKTGVTFNNALNLTGGNADATYYFSFSNEVNNGVIPNNNFHKNTFKVAGDSKLSNKFTASGSINFINDGGTRLQQGSNLSGVMLGLLRTPPSFDNANGYSNPVNTPATYEFPDGTERSYRGFGIYDNPWWTVNNNLYKDDVNREIGGATFNYLPFDWLTITYRLGNDFYEDNRNGHIALGSGTLNTGQIQQDDYFNMDINSDLFATFKTDITKDFKLDAVIGQNMFQHQQNETFEEGDNLVLPGFYNISNASSFIDYQYLTRKRTAAFYGDLGLSFKNMIFIDLTGRNEWSTTLPTNHSSFFYPSVSGGFVFTELDPLKNTILPFGKIRASYAVLANDAPEYYTTTPYSSTSFADGWTNGDVFPFNGISGFERSAYLGNPNLKPEQAKTFEIGADLKFYQNRAGINFTYYDKRDNDLILAVPIAPTTGYQYEDLNAASMTNKGIELTITGVPVKNKNFEWDLSFNLTTYKNEVLSLAPGVPNVYIGGFTDPQIRAVAGEPYGEIYGYDYARDGNGNVIIDDKTGYPIALNSNQTDLGNTLPKYTFGFNNEFHYRNFFLSFLIDVRNGAKTWNGTQGILYALGTAATTANRGTTTVFNGVLGHYDANGNLVVDKNSSGGEITNTKEAALNQSWYGGLGGGFSDADVNFIQKTDWIRLREITFGYSLSQNVLKKTGFKSCEVYITGKNLWLRTPYQGVDPETNLFGAFNAQGFDYFNMPNTGSIVLGIKVGI